MTAERRKKYEAEARDAFLRIHFELTDENIKELFGSGETHYWIEQHQPAISAWADLIDRLVGEAVAERDREWRDPAEQLMGMDKVAFDAGRAEERKARGCGSTSQEGNTDDPR